MRIAMAGCLCIPSSAQSVEAFLQWAAAHAAPIPKAVGLANLIGSARLVALGEPAHGTHEPLSFRNALFRDLVESQGFTAIALETGFPESARIEEFINGGDDDPLKAARKGFTWGFGELSENQELITWMRKYNADHSHGRKLHFYGIDLSLGGPSGSTPTPLALTNALTYLNRVDAVAAAHFSHRLDPYLKSFDQSDALCAAIDDLVAFLERERPTFIAASSAREFEYAHRNAVVAQQANRMFRVTPTAAAKDGIPPEAWQAMSARDAAMAENVLWALAQEGLDGRVLLFAHNAHIKNAPTRGGVWTSLSQPPEAMGAYLKSSLAESMVTIGGVSNEKSPRVAIENSFEEPLASLGLNPFMLDLRTAAGDPVASAWLRQDRNIRTNRETFLTVRPGLAFDAVIYWDKLTPSRPSE
jgi:erythromycin esterase